MAPAQFGVQRKEKLKGKIHQVFKSSFDAKQCFNEYMTEQKLEYIHHNPVKGEWKLVDDLLTTLIRAQDFTNWVEGQLSTSDITKT